MRICPDCGQQNPDIARFCLACGTSFEQSATAEGRERKIVSILFVDLVGFTARSHAADPEDVHAALFPYQATLRREIERFGGKVEKFIGDAVMSIFGAPLAHEDDPERAVRAGLRAVEAIDELNRSNPHLNLSIRAAVNTGQGLVTLGARPEAGEGMVTGDVVNTASRLQGVAPVGGVVVGEMTYRATRSVIDYRLLDPAKLKGKPEPTTIWQALSPRGRPSADLELVNSTPMVGRQIDLSSLAGAYQRALTGPGVQLVAVVGEAGIGKTRLLAEFASYLNQHQRLVYWRHGRCLPYGEGITFWALGEIFKAHAGILDSDDPARAGDKLRSTVATVIEDPSEQQWFLSRLGPLVGVDLFGTARGQREESFAAWRRFLEAIARQRPLVLVFEDLHWADPSLVQFLEHLADSSEHVAMVILCSARPELYDKHPGWRQGEPNATTVWLAPLDDDETTQLISSLLSDTILPAEIQSAVLQRAEGNPLYAEEFVGMLSDRGLLEQRGEVRGLEQGIEIPVPDSVHALIAARIDDLSHDRKSLLHDASVVGRVFWSGALAAIGEVNPDSVVDRLQVLGGQELVRRSPASSMGAEQEYVFWHALVRDVCYGQLTRTARAFKHQAVGAWIEAVAERLEDHAEVLAYHYETALGLARASRVANLAELEQRTQRFLMLAGDRAMALDVRRASRYYHAALALLAGEDPGRAHALAQLGEAQRLSGMVLDAERYLEEAVSLFHSAGDHAASADVALKLAISKANRGDHLDALGLIDTVVRQLEPLPPTLELALAYAYGAEVSVFSGDPVEGLVRADKAIALASRFGASPSLVEAHRARGTALSAQGNPAALVDAREALRLALSLDLGDQAALSYDDVADLVAWIEGPSAGLEILHLQLKFATQRGLGWHEMITKGAMAGTLFVLGHWDQASSLSEEVIEWARVHVQPSVLLMALTTEARQLAMRGEIADAEALT